MMKAILFLGILCSSAICTGCNSGSKSTKIPPNTTSTPFSISAELRKNGLNNNLFSLNMGSGINSVVGTASSGQSCLVAVSNPANIYIANPSTKITLDQVQSLGSVEKNFGVDVSGKFGADRFSFSTTSNFVSDAVDNDYTINLIYLYEYAGRASFVDGSLKESDEALTHTAAEMVHTDQQRFKDMCGDEFIQQMDAGATLGVRLTLSFNSHRDQEKFQSKLDSSLGLVNITASIQQAAANSNVHVGFSLGAIQLGGEPYKLNDIFGLPDVNGNYPFLECGSINSNNEEACKKMIDAIISYAQTLKTQLTNPDGSLKLNNLYYTNPTSISYSSIGVKVGAVDPTPETLQAMQDLTANYDKVIYEYTFATHYLKALRGFLHAPVINELKEISERLAKQLEIYNSPTYRVVNCYRNSLSENCVKIKQDVDVGIQQYSINSLQRDLLDYLEGTSYSANLYTYNGGAVYEPSNYSIAEDCIMAPTSFYNYAFYALNCDGKWLKMQQNNFKVIVNELKSGVNIMGLSYYSGPADGVQMKINYPDMLLNQDSLNPNFYFLDQVLVQAESAPNQTDFSGTTGVGLTKLYHNQA